MGKDSEKYPCVFAVSLLQTKNKRRRVRVFRGILRTHPPPEVLTGERFQQRRDIARKEDSSEPRLFRQNRGNRALVIVL